MKKIRLALGLALAAIVVGTAFTACSNNDNPTPSPTKELSKIVCVSVPASQSPEEYYAASKLGGELVDYVLTTYPTSDTEETYLAFSNELKGYASDPQVKAVIFTQAIEQVISAFKVMMKDAGRTDILVAGGITDTPEVSQLCDVLIGNNEEECGKQVAEQAKNWDCDILVHYSFPRHMAAATVKQKHDAMKAKAEELKVSFVDRECQDFVKDGDLAGARKALKEDIAKVIKENEGKKICFFCSNCGLQVALQQAILDEPQAFYALPCCPSPFHGFQEAFGLTPNYDDVDGSIKDIATYLKAHDAQNRYSTWKNPVNIAVVNALYQYAEAYVNNKLSSKVDMDYLKTCYSTALGREVVSASKIDGSGDSYPNYLVNTPDVPINFADYLE